ncbi:MAG: hypothetical protein IT204_06060 [Fimbriimonadaceae bacterium]|nr:hypothetical protein [Fimbriimonadaceae bacterium]
MYRTTGRRELWQALLWLWPAAPLAGLTSTLVAPPAAGGSALLVLAGWLFVMPLLAGAWQARPARRPGLAAGLLTAVSKLGG